VGTLRTLARAGRDFKLRIGVRRHSGPIIALVLDSGCCPPETPSGKGVWVGGAPFPRRAAERRAERTRIASRRARSASLWARVARAVTMARRTSARASREAPQTASSIEGTGPAMRGPYPKGRVLRPQRSGTWPSGPSAPAQDEIQQCHL
jgi:hypothetical protein